MKTELTELREEIAKIRQGLEIVGEGLDHLRLDLAVLLNYLNLTFEDVPAKPAERRLVETFKARDLGSYGACGILDPYDRGGA